MNNAESILNKLLVKIFNDILYIEEKSLIDMELNDISITELHTIEAIGVDRPNSMGEVAAKLKITLGTLTIAIDKLIKKGYVERRRTEEDRRIVRVNLTEKGRDAYYIHHNFHKEMVSSMVSNFSKDEEKVLIKAIDKLNVFFEEKYKN